MVVAGRELGAQRDDQVVLAGRVVVDALVDRDELNLGIVSSEPLADEAGGGDALVLDDEDARPAHASSYFAVRVGVIRRTAFCWLLGTGTGWSPGWRRSSRAGRGPHASQCR